MKNAAERRSITITRLSASFTTTRTAEEDARSLLVTVHSRTIRGFCNQNQNQNQPGRHKKSSGQNRQRCRRASVLACWVEAPACARSFANDFPELPEANGSLKQD